MRSQETHQQPSLKELQEINLKITATAHNLQVLMKMREQKLQVLFPSDFPDGLEVSEDASLNKAINSFFDGLY